MDKWSNRVVWLSVRVDGENIRAAGCESYRAWARASRESFSWKVKRERPALRAPIWETRISAEWDWSTH